MKRKENECERWSLVEMGCRVKFRTTSEVYRKTTSDKVHKLSNPNIKNNFGPKGEQIT